MDYMSETGEKIFPFFLEDLIFLKENISIIIRSMFFFIQVNFSSNLCPERMKLSRKHIGVIQDK